MNATGPVEVNVSPFVRHLLCTWPFAFILPWTAEKWNLFLKCASSCLYLMLAIKSHKIYTFTYMLVCNLSMVYHNWTPPNSLGFNEVWLAQGVGNANIFQNLVKQRLQDHFIQAWNSRLKDFKWSQFLYMHKFVSISTLIKLCKGEKI